MGKKSKSKTPKVVQENRVVENNAKASPSAKKTASVIDEVLAGKKRKKDGNAKKPEVVENTVVKEQKTSSSAKKPASAIDEIFAGRKRKQIEAAEAKKLEEEKIEKSKRLKRKREKRTLDENQTYRPKKRTQDGITIYTEEELGLNKEGGSTPLCPFDCSCCF